MTARWNTEAWVLLGVSLTLLAAFLAQLLVSRLTSVPIPMLKRHMHVAGIVSSALLLLRTPDLRGYREEESDWSPAVAHLFSAQTLVLVRRCHLYLCLYCLSLWIWATYEALHTHMRRAVPTRLRRALQGAFVANTAALLLLDVLASSIRPHSHRTLPARIANVLMAFSVAMFAAVQVINHVRLRRSIQLYLAERKRAILATEVAAAAAAANAGPDGSIPPLLHLSAVGSGSAPVTPRTSTHHAKVLSVSQYSSTNLAAAHLANNGGAGTGVGAPGASPSKRNQRANSSWSINNNTNAIATPGGTGGGGGTAGPSALLLSMGITSRRGDIFLELPMMRPSIAAASSSSAPGAASSARQQGSFSTSVLETLHYPSSAMASPAFFGTSCLAATPLLIASPAAGAANADLSSPAANTAQTPVLRQLRQSQTNGRARSGSGADQQQQHAQASPSASSPMDGAAIPEVEMAALALPAAQSGPSFRSLRINSSNGVQTGPTTTAPIPEYAAGRGETPSPSASPSPTPTPAPDQAGWTRRQRTEEGGGAAGSRHGSGHSAGHGHGHGPSSRVPASHHSQINPQSPHGQDAVVTAAPASSSAAAAAPVAVPAVHTGISPVLQASMRNGSLGSTAFRPGSLPRSGTSFASALANLVPGAGGGGGGGGGPSPATAGGGGPWQDSPRTRNLSISTSALFAHQSPSALVKLRHVLGIGTSAATPLTGTEARLAETRALEERVAHIAHFFVLSFLAQLALFVGTVAALALDFGGDADRFDIPWTTLADALALFAGAVLLWYSWVCTGTTLRSCSRANWNWNPCDSRLPNAARRVRDAHDLAFGVGAMTGGGTPQLRAATMHSGRLGATGVSKLMLLDEDAPGLQRERSVQGSRNHTHWRASGGGGWGLPPPSPLRASFGLHGIGVGVGRRASESSFFGGSAGLGLGHGHGVAPNAGTGFLQPTPSPAGPIFVSPSDFAGETSTLASPSPRASTAAIAGGVFASTPSWHPALARIDCADAKGQLVLTGQGKGELTTERTAGRHSDSSDSPGAQLTPRATATAADTDGDANHSPHSDFGAVSPALSIPVSWPRHAALVVFSGTVVPPTASGSGAGAELVSDGTRALCFARSDSVVSEIIDAGGAASSGVDGDGSVLDSPGGTQSAGAPPRGPFEDPCVLPPHSHDAMGRARTVAFSTPEPLERDALDAGRAAAAVAAAHLHKGNAATAGNAAVASSPAPAVSTPPTPHRTHAALTIRVRSDSDSPLRIRTLDASPASSTLSPPKSGGSGTRRLQIQRPLPLPAAGAAPASESASPLSSATGLPPTGRVHIKMRKSSPSPSPSPSSSLSSLVQRPSPGSRSHRISLRMSSPLSASPTAAPVGGTATVAANASPAALSLPTLSLAQPAPAPVPTLTVPVPTGCARKGSDSTSRAAGDDDAGGFRITVDRPRSVYAARRSHHSLEFHSPPLSPGLGSGGHGGELSFLSPHSYAGMGLGSVRSSQLGVPGGGDGSDGLGLRSALSSPTPDSDAWPSHRDVEKSTHVSSIHLHSQRSTRHNRNRSGGMGSIDDEISING